MKPMTKSQGRLDWGKNYGKPQSELLNPSEMFNSKSKRKTVKKAKWEDRNAIDLPEVRAKLKKIQRES
jgi:hypothetical protein